MGFSKSYQADGGKESEGKKWVIAGISIWAPLKSISTTTTKGYEEEDDACSTTPTARESRIPEKLLCPPAPRKRRPRPVSTCHLNGVREFFNPPDLESVFIRHAGRQLS